MVDTKRQPKAVEPVEIATTLALVQYGLNRLHQKAEAEGFELEITPREDGGFEIALVRRLVAPPEPPTVLKPMRGGRG